MRNSKGFRAATLSATSVLAVLAATSGAYAQVSEVTEEDVFIVTGTKQNLTTQEVEVSVEFFDESRIENESLFRLDDVLARVPNVNSTGGEGITIRGIGRDGAAGQGVTSNVYLDGAPINGTVLRDGLTSVWDIGQIEVLRGPQSTVQGRNALAGAIVLRTNDPTYDWESKIRARYGTFDTQQYAGVISGPIIADQLAFRLAADYQATDGFVDNGLTGQNNNGRENIMLRGKLLLEPELLPNLRAEVTVDYNDSDGDARNGVVNSPFSILDPDFYNFDFKAFNSFRVPEVNSAETLRVLTDIEYDLNLNWSVQFIGTYEDHSSQEAGGDLSNPLEFFGQVLQSRAYDFSQDAKTYSAELRAIYTFDRWSGSLGAYYFDDEVGFAQDFAVTFAELADPFTITPDDSVVQTNEFRVRSVRNFAFYGQSRFDLNDQWTFDFSLRYDNERFVDPGLSVNPPTFTPPSCVVNISQPLAEFLLGPGADFPVTCLAAFEFGSGPSEGEASTTFSAILPRGAVTYNVTDDLALFFSGQRGYRAGGTFTFFDENGFNFEEFDPEYLTTYEVGFRSQWLDGDLTLNGNVFYSRYRDQQVETVRPTGFGFETRNVGSSRIYGAEFIGDYQATDELNIYGSLSLLQTEFLDFPFQEPDPSVESEFENLEGLEFSNAANFSFTIGGNYEHASGMFANANVAYTGPREGSNFEIDEANFTQYQAEAVVDGVDLNSIPINTLTEELEARTLLNAQIGYRNDRFALYVYGTNLLDDNTPILTEFAAVEPITGGGGRTLSNGFGPVFEPRQVFGPPRVVGVNLDLTF